MNLGRIFANAIARRVAYVLVAMALAWLGLSDAKAGKYGCDVGPAASMCSQPQAYAACMTHARTYAAPYNVATCTGSPYWARGCRADGGGCVAGSDANYYYDANRSCGSTPSETFSSTARIPTGSAGCSSSGPGNHCTFSVTNNGDGTYTRNFDLANNVCDVLPECPSTGWYMNPGTGLCQPIEQECASNQTKNPTTGECENACPAGMHADSGGACQPDKDNCPAGNVRAPSGQCLPGEGQCSAGEARRPNGTCGRDSDGDGQADEDDEDPENDPDRETASGGDSCNSPPSCSGGPIDCLQVKIQWRIDCNTRKNENISGGACSAMPVCTGDKCRALEYSQLLMQWRTACALEKLAIPGGGTGGDGEKIKPDFEAFAGTSDGANPDDSIFLPDGDAEGFNQSLVSYGAGALGWNFSVEGQQFSLPQQVTDFVAVLRWLIIAAASLVGIAIAWGRL